MARPSSDLQRLHGVHCVQEAIRAGRRRLDRVLVRQGRRRPEVERLLEEARAAGLPVVEVDSATVGRGAGPGSPPQAVALEAGPLPELDLTELLEPREGAAPGRPVRLVALDGVEDPQNAGAIVRVAESAGADGLILTERRSPPLGAALARASAGAVEWLPVARAPNLRNALKFLKKEGFWTIGAEPEGAVSLFEAPPALTEGPLVVVLGAEGRGLRPGVRDEIDHRVRIPMAGRVASLNVATAAAVILFELLRRDPTRG
jgi:23S rRNA (guanosine2251-2'-O)-methyltransferase